MPGPGTYLVCTTHTEPIIEEDPGILDEEDEPYWPFPMDPNDPDNPYTDPFWSEFWPDNDEETEEDTSDNQNEDEEDSGGFGNFWDNIFNP